MWDREGWGGAAARSRLGRSRASTYPRGRARLTAPRRGGGGRGEVRHEVLWGGWGRGASPSSGRGGGVDGEGRWRQGRAADSGLGGKRGGQAGGLAELGHAAFRGGRRGLGLTRPSRPAACLARPAPWAALRGPARPQPQPRPRDSCLCGGAPNYAGNRRPGGFAPDRRYFSSFQVGLAH